MIGKARVGARVERERGEVVAIIVHDLRDAVVHVAGNGLTFPQHLARDRIERIVVHPYERAAKKIDAVEHQAAGHARLTASEIAFRLAQAQCARVASELKRMIEARCDPLQHREIEVDRVPPRDHIRVIRADALAECIERRPFVCARARALGHRASAAVHDEHLIDLGRVHRDREQALALGVRLDVESERARIELDLCRPQHRIVEYEIEARAVRRLPFDLAAAFDAALDQIAERESHIPFEGVDAGFVQPVAQRRDILRRLDRNAHDGIAAERQLARCFGLGRAQRLRPSRVARADVEVGALPVVAHQKGAPILQPTIYMYDRQARPVAARYDSIACLEDEAAYFVHVRIVREVGAIVDRAPCRRLAELRFSLAPTISTIWDDTRVDRGALRGAVQDAKRARGNWVFIGRHRGRNRWQQSLGYTCSRSWFLPACAVERIARVGRVIHGRSMGLRSAR